MKGFLYVSLLSLLISLNGCLETKKIERDFVPHSLIKIPENGLVDTKPTPCISTGNIYDGCYEEPHKILPTIPNIELNNFIDPFYGDYTTKLTLPKNFTGFLYLGGLNISSLLSKPIKVRFKFGKELKPIDIEATYARAQGITPTSDQEVLQLDMTAQPFKNLRLLYDLYDYTDYRKKDGVEEFLDTNGKVVGPLYTSQDALNYNLYCRGLYLQDDPTFKATEDIEFCDEEGEECLYTYAKIVDKGLVLDETTLVINPNKPQLGPEENLKKCLPDNNNVANLGGVLNAISVGNGSNNLSYNELVTLEGDHKYLYQGPFRSIGPESWGIKGKALIYPSSSTHQAVGLFQNSYNPGDPNSGFTSMMFPRAGKIGLKANTEYWGSEAPLGVRTLQKTATGGSSLFMDGSNLRMKNFNEFTNEGISSCNVTATIELITTDPATGKEVSLLKNPNRELKLQLIRPTLIPITGGTEVLIQPPYTCANDNQCFLNQGCFNGRCWDKKLVSSYNESEKGEANRAIGEVCKSDYDCSSFCCDSSVGVCGVQIISEEETYLCSKSPGETCITKEFCRKENITECKIIKTGTDSNGKTTCDLKCYNNPTFGDCRNGICVAPTPSPVPAFDPQNPDCTNAEDPLLSI